MADKDDILLSFLSVESGVRAMDTGIRLALNSYIFQSENYRWVYRCAFSDRLLSKASALFYGCQGTIPRISTGVYVCIYDIAQCTVTGSIYV